MSADRIGAKFSEIMFKNNILKFDTTITAFLHRRLKAFKLAIFWSLNFGLLVTVRRYAPQQAPMSPRMRPNAFIYAKLLAWMPFSDMLWQESSTAIPAEPGFIDNAWLSGMSAQAVGG
ncbi:MAG: hypothetical protein R8G34_17070 [Paracoccaceae bacterium]|nr:hypothetical protein [Paracoccaceae bacterium]